MIKVKIISAMDIAKVIGAREKIMTIPEHYCLDDLLSDLENEYGEPITKFLYNSNRVLAQAVLLNGRNITFLQGKNTKLKDGDEIFLVPIAAGG